MRRRRKGWSEILGISQAKRKWARKTGIPTTKQGWKRKALNTLTGGAYGRYERQRAKLHRMGCLLPCLVVVILAIFVSSALAVTGTPTKNSVNVREGLSTKSKKVDTVGKKDTVEILGQEVDGSGVVWYQIQLKNGKTGHINGDFLAVDINQTTAKLTTTAKKTTTKATTTQSTTKTMTCTVKASCPNKNHVGNNWSQYFEVNGEQLKSSKKVSVTAGQPVVLYSEIIENDKYPDEGYGRTEYVPTEDEMKKGFTVKQEVDVTEDRGRYAGYTATWTVTWTFK